MFHHLCYRDFSRWWGPLTNMQYNRGANRLVGSSMATHIFIVSLIRDTSDISWTSGMSEMVSKSVFSLTSFFKDHGPRFKYFFYYSFPVHLFCFLIWIKLQNKQERVVFSIAIFFLVELSP